MGDELVQTVLGPVRADELGLTLPHEHLFVRIEGWSMPPRDEEQKRFAEAPVSLENLAHVHRRALSNKDNCRIDDLEVVRQEVGYFRRAGGGTIVEQTLADLGRSPQLMERVSRETGVHVVAGCGWYVQASHPLELADMSVEAIAELLESELVDGIGRSGVKPGIIGEIGTSNPITPGERKVLRAAALAHRRTGVPISVHLFPAGGTATEALDVLEEAGARPASIALCHLDGQDPIDVDLHAALAARGAYVEYDVFGANWASDDARDTYAPARYWSPPPSDQQRVRAIAELFLAGFGERMLVSHDVCTKIQQRVWGGPGFSHIPRYMVPFFLANGFVERDVDQLVRAQSATLAHACEPEEVGAVVRPVGCAIVGLGPMGAEHAAVLAHSSAAELLVCCDLAPELASRAPEGAAFTTDLDEALGHPGLEAVFVCTSESRHRDPVMRALARGCAVFCEKPFASTLADCDAMIGAAGRAGALLVVGHILRFDLRYLEVAEAMRDGRLGRVVHLFARRTSGRNEGAMVRGRTTLPLYLGVHDLDVFGWLAGDIESVYAEAGGADVIGPGIADTVLGTVRFASGAVGAVELSWAMPTESGYEWDSRLEVIGTAGSAYVDIADTGVSIFTRDGPRFPETTYWPTTYGSPSGILRTEDEHFLACVRDGASWPFTLKDARAAIAAALALDRSGAEHRPVALGEIEIAAAGADTEEET